jgi:hypothetical protein
MAIPAHESSRFILPVQARARQVFYDNIFLVQALFRGGRPMSRLYDDYDELEFDFADDAVARQMRRKELREKRRLAVRRASGPGNRRSHENYEDDFDDYETYDGDDRYEDYDDYNDDEFDAYSGINAD